MHIQLYRKPNLGESQQTNKQASHVKTNSENKLMWKIDKFCQKQLKAKDIINHNHYKM